MVYDEDEPKLDDNGLPSDVLSDTEDDGDNSEIEEQETEAPDAQSQNAQQASNKIQQLTNRGGAKPQEDSTLNSIRKMFGKGSSPSPLSKFGGGKDAAVNKAKQEAMKTFLKAAGPYLGVAAIVILLIIIIVSIVSSAAAYSESKTDPENMKNNSYITSEYFYGLRSVYIDDAALTDCLQLSYKQYIIDVVNQIKQQDSSITTSLTIPEVGEGETLTNAMIADQHIINMSIAIGNIVANNTSAYEGVDFATLYDSIPYFGLTEEQSTSADEYITTYLKNNTLIASNDENVDSIISEALANEELNYINNLCEKVMIKDEIATESGLTDIQSRQYIASIYMPNKDVVITDAIYAIRGQNEEFTTKYALIEYQSSETIHAQQEISKEVEIVLGLDDKNITLSKFSSIDSANPRLFGSGVSLFEALRLSPQDKTYFMQQTREDLDNQQVYSWKPADQSYLYLTFESNSSFIFTEFGFNVQ